jgi:hypothetical protein
MSDISYAGAPVPVRDDLAAAHRRAWERLAQPGNWWTGAQRVAMGGEIRNAARCALCRERKAALSPYGVAGEHDTVSDLPNAAVDVIHRVVTDPGRLSRKWFDGVLVAGLSDAEYVEVIGVVVTVFSIDSFCRGLGVDLHPLPAPVEGAPSRYRPASACDEGAWVATIPGTRATGAEKDLYGSAAYAANVIRALSLVPDAVRQLQDLSAAHYLRPAEMIDLTRGRSIDRAQMELVAGRVSALRECFY